MGTVENFNPANLQNDVALLHLESPVTLAEHINVICMPSAGEDFEKSQNCVANGWGKDIFGKQGRYAVILKKVELDIVPQGQCNDELRTTRLSQYFKLHKSFICAGGQPGKDTCKGDGGAPLACPFEENRYKLTGLVSLGYRVWYQRPGSVRASVLVQTMGRQHNDEMGLRYICL
ncbi:unnamed protein product [Leptosia nina]|uniref:Peptidase S1 domain-containing protein n=1 Tax=Leptosia nina TaxID=320188 RepID=A0AAV1K006_9NEOP